jgi:hypothetical protein
MTISIYIARMHSMTVEGGQFLGGKENAVELMEHIIFPRPCSWWQYNNTITIDDFAVLKRGDYVLRGEMGEIIIMAPDRFNSMFELAKCNPDEGIV